MLGPPPVPQVLFIYLFIELLMVLEIESRPSTWPARPPPLTSSNLLKFHLLTVIPYLSHKINILPLKKKHHFPSQKNYECLIVTQKFY